MPFSRQGHVKPRVDVCRPSNGLGSALDRCTCRQSNDPIPSPATASGSPISIAYCLGGFQLVHVSTLSSEVLFYLFLISTLARLLVFHYGDVPVAIPPIFPLPEQSAGDEATSPLSQSPSHKLDLFPENCKYFIICCEIAKTCYRSGKSDHDMPTLALAGDQYKKLLSWFEKVPPKLSSKDYQDNRIVLLQ